VNRRSSLLAIAAGIISAAAFSVPAASAAPAASTAQPNTTTVSGNLSAVAAMSPSDAWAVGATRTPTTYPLTMRWTGTAWRKVASPRLAGASLSAVAMTSASNAWAVGTSTSSTTGAAQSLILHWNGSAWTRVPSPDPSTSVTLSGVATAPDGQAWAVGSYSSKTKSGTLILHWNGTTWSRVPSPSPGFQPALTAVTVLSARSAWAVGHYCHKTCESFRTLILRWNGHTWKQVASPSPGFGGTSLNGVTATSAHSAWAVGTIIGCGCNPDGGVILHWNGKVWKATRAPNPTGVSALSAVVQVSSHSAWAVGGYLRKGQYPYLSSFVLRWNGKSWTQVASPSLTKKFSNLTGLAVVSSHFGLAVGSNLSLRWNGSAWK
jgi:hypothetical protein